MPVFRVQKGEDLLFFLSEVLQLMQRRQQACAPGRHMGNCKRAAAFHARDKRAQAVAHPCNSEILPKDLRLKNWLACKSATHLHVHNAHHADFGLCCKSPVPGACWGTLDASWGQVLWKQDTEQKHRFLQSWVMRSFAQTNARMIRTMRVFNVNASAFRGHF